jgi:putative Ca2+/H+ antiporter (TMEM165/GDT1 family)
VGRIKLSALHKAAGFMFLAFGAVVLLQALAQLQTAG